MGTQAGSSIISVPKGCGPASHWGKVIQPGGVRDGIPAIESFREKERGEKIQENFRAISRLRLFETAY